MPKQALILANGEPPKKRLLASLLEQTDLFVCADGGANTALRMRLKPDAIVGDLDSIHAETLAKFQHVRRYEDRDEDSTDLEKAIKWAIRQRYDHITVIGGAGRRMDHTVGNLGVLAKFYPDAIITLIDDDGEMRYVGRSLTFDAELHSVASLIPLTRCEGITTSGLLYALEDEALELGVREGTSNVVISSPVTITVKKGTLLCYRVHSSHHK
jgi:thiamine pyrophosphokinase